MHESHTPQQLGRTVANGRDAAWEDAFEAQLTGEMTVSVMLYAKKRAEWIQRTTKRHDTYLARELYQDAVTDTWLGDVAWGPAKVPLELHLKRTIRSRSAARVEHLVQFPEDRVRALKLDMEAKMSEALEIQQPTDQKLPSYIDDIVGKLYELAGDDAEVIQILDCFANDQIDRRDIMRATGLDRLAYHNARRRLVRLVENLPNDLREQAIRAMA
ncbi:hypothetical protein EON77_10950 [bacterium]|nr:MAG: hypothetical protein EON77_10950 [bacterium]